MTHDTQRPPPPQDAPQPVPSDTDASVEALRDILLRGQRQQMADLEAKADDLERQFADKEALIARISPYLGEAIRRKIRDSREEMVEALYPIIGQLVMRAVQEAISDLARRLDAQVRTSFNPRSIWWRVRARLGGASDAELALRESLPFEVTEIFLIHRETGLLLRYLAQETDASSDSDLVSGMLTAIRDFSQDAFGRGQEGDLDEIEYGDRHILIETAQHAYLAVVVDGVEPPGFRAEMRERIIEINHAHETTLRDYQGDATPFTSTEPRLRSLLVGVESRALSSTQKRLLASAAAAIFICLIGACLAGRWVWQTVRITPTPVVIVVVPTASPTRTPLPTASPTPTPVVIPGLMTGHVWVRQGPSVEMPRTGMVLAQGQAVEILAAFDAWYQVRWARQDQAEDSGWVPAAWVGTSIPIPSWIITPTPVPAG